MKKIKYGILLCLCLLLVSCAGQEGTQEEGTPIEIYYLNKEETKVNMEPYNLQSTGTQAQVEELLEVLASTPSNLANKAPITGSVNVLEYRMEETQLILKFDETYKELTPTTEILTRAAIVRSFTQIEGVDWVVMQVREEALTDALGSPVGVMSADMFIDNAGEEINAYEEVRLRLYFANEAGDGLIEAIRPYVSYSSNISMERRVLEQLIAGPKNEKIYPCINPQTKIINVTVRDGICYVNLDETFLTQVYNVTAEVTIYSIVNSLVELPNVNKVQILINGESEVDFRENISFTTMFERNLELVGNTQESSD